MNKIILTLFLIIQLMFSFGQRIDSGLTHRSTTANYNRDFTGIVVTTDEYSENELITDVLLPCIPINNIEIHSSSEYGLPSSIGYFTNADPDFPMSNGIVLSTGYAIESTGPNGSGPSNGDSSWVGDDQLLSWMTNYISQNPQHGIPIPSSFNNSTSVSFEFVPVDNQINFNYVFVSGEYGSYQCSYTDTFAFFLENIDTGEIINLAVVPDSESNTPIPVTVVTIRDSAYNNDCSSKNPEYFNNYYNSGEGPHNFNGDTVLLTASAAVIPGAHYRIRLVVADMNDTQVDSAVFIEGGTFDFGTEDLDGDGISDMCDSDIDGDGVSNNDDCSPFNPTISEPSIWYIDSDNDGYGTLDETIESCEKPDGFVHNFSDNCPSSPNPDQEDMDGDGIGDVCDEDIDGDGISNEEDCEPENPEVSAPIIWYADLDNDGFGDPNDTIEACERPEGYIASGNDNCPNTANPNQEDLDQDGLGDVCDDDIDGDGISNEEDCEPENPEVSAPTIWYADLDNDGFGDSNDTVEACERPEGYLASGDDNCPNISNPNQEDLDQDGIGNVCDDDIDGDGVNNEEDCEPENPNIGLPQIWYLDTDNDGYGVSTDVITSCIQPSGYVAQPGDCNDEDNTLHPGAQYFEYSNNPNFNNSIISPLTGEATDNYTFEVKYFDEYNRMPSYGFPRIVLDYNSDGNYNSQYDRTIILNALDPSDTNLTDGKVYIGSVSPLEVHQNYSVFAQSYIEGCETIFGPFDMPDVLEQPDIEIFANDITFSNNNPAVNSPMIVRAQIHNRSDFPAENFIVGLENHVDNTNYPDIEVEYIAPNSSTSVEWLIITPSEPAFVPMKVTIDKTNVIAESNELDNTAIRPYINGDYNLPGGIEVSNSVSPYSGYPNTSFSVSGNAIYVDTAIELEDPTVDGAQVTLNIPSLNEEFQTHTNSNGNFTISIPRSNYLEPGIYEYIGEITDFTLTSNFSGYFVVTTPTEDECFDKNLKSNISFSPNRILYGETSNLFIDVINNGCLNINQSTSLEINQSNGIHTISNNASVPALEVGESHRVEFNNLTFDEIGGYSVSVQVDSENEIDEVNESDNYDTDYIQVLEPKPDLVLYSGPSGTAYLCETGEGVSFSIRNNGHIPSGSFTCNIDVYRNDVLLTSYNTNYGGSINPHETGFISIPFTYSEIGSYRFEVSIDPNNNVDELNEDNNISNRTISIQECKPDLTVSNCKTGLEVEPVNPLNVLNNTYKAIIHNIGRAATMGNTKVTFSVTTNGVTNSYDHHYTGSLDVGESQEISITVPSAGIDSELTVILDNENHIGEENENNNSSSASLCHDYYVQEPCNSYSQFWRDDLFYQYESVTPWIKLHSNGLYIADEVDVLFEVSGPGIPGTANLGTVSLQNVGGCNSGCNEGRYISLPTTFAFNELGTYTFTITVDPDGLFPECNEDNNIFTRVVEVQSKADMRTLSEFINPSELNPDPNEPVTLEVSYENIGFQNVNDQMKMKVLFDEQEVATLDGVPGLLNGENNTLTVPVPVQSDVVGIHVVKIIIDSEDEIDELNELNNDATRTIVVGEAANLYFEYFEANNSSPNFGEEIQLMASIGNNGEVDTEAILKFTYFNQEGLEIYIGNMPIEIAASGTSGYVMNWIVDYPDAIIKAEIVNSSIQEFNELDNWITLQLGLSDCEFQDCLEGDCGDSMPADATYAAVQALCEAEIVEGINDNVEPDSFIRKEDIAKILYKGLFGGNTPPTIGAFFPNPFPDLQVEGDLGTYHQYARALSYLDYGDRISVFDRDSRLFGPCKPLQKQFYIKALLETFNVDVSQFNDPSIADFDEASTSMLPYIAVAAANDIIENDGSAFHPHDNITRAEAFVYLHRILSNGNIEIPIAQSVNDLQNFFSPINFTAENGNKVPTIADGNFNHYTKSNFSIPDRKTNFSFAHGYNSLYTTLHYGFAPIRPLSKAWTHTYNAYIVEDDFCQGGTNYFIKWSNGSINNYNTIEGYQTKGVYDQFNINNDVISIKKKNQVIYSFSKLNANANIYYLTSITDRNENTTSISYQDAVYPNQKRITAVTAPSGRTYNFTYYTDTDLIDTVTDPLNREIKYEYDDGRLIKFTDAKGLQTTYGYDDINNEMTKFLLSQVTLPKGNTINNNYDNDNKLTSTKINDEQPTEIEVNPNGDFNYDDTDSFTTSIVTVPETNGNTTDVITTKDELGNTTSVVSETVNAQISYAETGVNINKPSNTNVNGIQLEYAYDAMGNLLRVDKPYGIHEEYTYTGLNDIATHTDGRGFTTTYTYDDGNLTQITDPLGNSVNIEVGNYGLPTSVESAEGLVTTYSYNDFGNVETVTLPLNRITHFTYDNASRLKIQEQFGLSKQFEYDENDNIVKEIDPLQHETAMEYDDNNNLIEIINAQNNSTIFTYDDEDRMKTQSFGGYTKSINYNNETGEVTSMVKPSGQTFNYSYDDKGRLTSNGDVSNIVYDDRNNITQITNELGTITFDYDDLNRIIAVIDQNGRTVVYDYDANSNVEKLTYSNGQEVIYTYDALNRLTKVTDWNQNETQYYYTNDSRLDYVSYPNGVQSDYSYDEAGRIIGIRHSLAEEVIYSSTMTLDEKGNIISEEIVSPIEYTLPDETETLDYNYSPTNRIQSAGNINFSFDDDGNTIQEGDINYEFNINDELIEVNSDSLNTIYKYDALGNRRVAIRNGAETRYVLDILGLAKVLTDESANGAPQQHYVHGLNMISRIQPDGSTRYYLGDLRGSTIAMVDEQGSITHKYAYSDFGETIASEEEDENPYQYMGLYGITQEDDNLQFVRARYYNPQIGRFLSEDPIWSTNLYPYAGNNPLNYIDVDGNERESVFQTTTRSGQKVEFLTIERSNDNDYSTNQRKQTLISMPTKTRHGTDAEINFGSIEVNGTINTKEVDISANVSIVEVELALIDSEIGSVNISAGFGIGLTVSNEELCGELGPFELCAREPYQDLLDEASEGIYILINPTERKKLANDIVDFF